VAAGPCFIGPAALITTGFAIAYVHLRQVPALSSILYGIRPAILAIVLAAMARLVVPKKKDWFFLVVGAIAAITTLLGVSELLMLLAGAGIGLGKAYLRADPQEKPPSNLSKSNTIFPLALWSSSALAGSKLGGLTLFFLKVGSILYGSGYVLIALLRAGLVTERGWLTENELLDAVAIGQFTPGPVLSTATFIGYLIEGPLGAAAATLAIFLPSFVFVRASAPYIPKLRASRLFSGLLDGASAASLGLLATATFVLARGALVNWPAFVILAVAIPAAMQPKLNATWIVVGGALAGLGVQALGLSP
jgi:chromate transporter